MSPPFTTTGLVFACGFAAKPARTCLTASAAARAASLHLFFMVFSLQKKRTALKGPVRLFLPAMPVS
jgi:hypothetical protein